MKTIRPHRIRIQLPLNSFWFAMQAAGFDRIEQVVKNSNQKRQQQREAAKRPALDLIHAGA